LELLWNKIEVETLAPLSLSAVFHYFFLIIEGNKLLGTLLSRSWAGE
jgi:hypothetical protein